jgi:hypothetical protein
LQNLSAFYRIYLLDLAPLAAPKFPEPFDSKESSDDLFVLLRSIFAIKNFLFSLTLAK